MRRDALLCKPLLLLHSSQAEQLAATAELQQEEEVVGGVKRKVEPHDVCVGALLQDTVLSEHALHLRGTSATTSSARASGGRTLLRITMSFLEITFRANTEGSSASARFNELRNAGGQMAAVSSSGRSRRTRNTRLDDPRPRQRIMWKSSREAPDWVGCEWTCGT